MKIQKLKVIGVDDYDPDSKQSSVEFETTSGQHFQCYSDGYDFSVGETADISCFYWIAGDGYSYDEMFDANESREKSIEHLSDWNYFCKGLVVDLEGDVAIVDCGGVLIPIDGFTSDRSAIGNWVGFRVDRLEVEKHIP